MADQLSLRLEADQLPDLPELRPMLPRPLPAPFDSEQHLFEPWWGGERALALIGPSDSEGAGAVRIVDAAGRDVSGVLPELSGLAVRVAARSAILDGELVVVDGSGRADARELARRLSGHAGAPSAFLCFDLLHLDGRSLLSQPLVRRREALRRVLRPGDEVVAVPAIATEGIALYQAAVAQGIAGVMARQRTSPYLPGVRSRLWRYVAAGAPAPAVTATATEAGAGTSAHEASPAGAAPVLALISRLPFEDW
jgi:bifunctional non-homologous end joining protein LigD